MYIDPKSKIAGISALTIRNFLRKTKNSTWQKEYLQNNLRVSPHRAQKITSELLELGYIEPDDRTWYKHYFRLTSKGIRFALATAAKPIRRSSAERVLEELIGRVRNVNQSKLYLYKVTKVGVFGSYLSNQNLMNDVDIALTLEPKISNHKRFQSLIWNKVAQAKKDGRKFANFTDELSWPQIEVMRYLKSRSRIISLQLIDDKVFKATKSKILYDISERPPKAKLRERHQDSINKVF